MSRQILPRRRRRWLAVVAAAAVVWGASGEVARTHELELTEVHVTFSSEGTFRIEVMNDPGWLLMRVEPFSGLGLSGRLDPGAGSAAGRDGADLRRLGAPLLRRGPGRDLRHLICLPPRTVPPRPTAPRWG